METIAVFSEPGYLAHNAARLDHLASLGLPLDGRSVLIVGAGIGDHAGFFLKRGCGVSITDGRQSNVEFMNKEHPEWGAVVLDVEREHLGSDSTWDVIHCYGLLYHCADWPAVIHNLGKFKPELLLLETCVSDDCPGGRREDAEDPRCGLTGLGCRPERKGVLDCLKRHFPFAYISRSQPNHDEFPVDWRDVKGEARCVFVASRVALDPAVFTEEVPMIQTRYV